jgi:predicted DCC family thiol-disulfide oxidoreductase YuxK
MLAPESATLRIFYDGLCPLCLREMQHLQRLDRTQRLDLQDINAADFAERFPHIDPVQADRILHGELTDGRLLYGLDVTVLAWRLVGRGRWVNFLRWPLIRPVADRVYLFFARHRHRISGWFGRPSTCVDGRCTPR